MQESRLGDFTTNLRVLLLAAMALVVGTGGVASAWVLLRLIALCTNLAYFHEFSFAPHTLSGLRLGPASVLIPMAGALAIGLMARYGSEKIRGHGIPEALEAILIGRSRIQPKVAVLKPLSSAISIGTGGPFGAEGPIIMTGGAIGSLFAQLFHMTAAERKVLLVAGAAAGMTGVFGTPIAAVLLAVELLLFEWKPRSFIPVVVACAVAALERGYVLPAAPLFAHAGTSPATPTFILGWLAIGLLSGLGSGVLTAMVYGSEDAFGHLRLHWMWWPVLGGLVVGLGGLVEPAALGVGYDSIADLLSGHLVLGAVAVLLLVKAVIWAVALGSGTSGGVLAPLLIMGGALGALAGHLLPDAGPGFWAMLGMAAMMGGTMRAPLTAALFAVELTGDFARRPAAVRRLRRRLCGDGAAAEAVDPDREGGAAGAPHHPRVPRRSLRADRGARRDGAPRRHPAGGDAGRGGRPVLHGARAAPQGLPGRGPGGPRARHGLAGRRAGVAP